jgi:hypothetical protein
MVARRHGAVVSVVSASPFGRAVCGGDDGGGINRASAAQTLSNYSTVAFVIDKQSTVQGCENAC